MSSLRISKRDLDKLAKICAALPESCVETWATHHTLRVKGKVFGYQLNDHHGDGRVAIWCKAPPGVQRMMVDADPRRFFVPPYVGHKGWIGVRLDVPVDWASLAEILAESWRMTAPKRLVAAADASAAAPAKNPAPKRAAKARPKKRR